MRFEEGTATSISERPLYTQTWLPDSPPKGMVAFFHGLGEHSGRYRHVAEALTKEGYGLHMGDLTGHGKTYGKRGHIMSWEEFREDARTIMEGARRAAPDATHFFGGHSLGGLIALSVAVGNPPGYQGVIASAPALRAAFSIPGWKVWLGSQLSRIAPGTSMSTGLPAKYICRDQAVVDAYTSDPLVHDKTSARMAIETFRAQAYILSHAHEIRLSLLMMYGTEDRVVSPVAGKEAFEQISSSDKTWREYEGYYHEIFNEVERERPLRDMINWMDARL